MPLERPLPATDLDSLPFWQACSHHELKLQRCDACGYYVYFPAPACRRCGSTKLTWTRLSGQGTVYTFVVVHHVVTPGFPPDQPYVVAWIELPEQAALRLLSNVVGCPPHSVYIGQKVAVSFEDVREGISVPVFTPVEQA
jgi:uncharacterized OB-fold protein